VEDWQHVEKTQQQGTLDGSIVAQAVILFMKGEDRVEMPAAKLHAELVDHAGDDLSLKDDKTWPKTGRTLWKRIREVTPLLEAHGIRAYRSSSNKEGRPIILDPDFTGGGDPDGEHAKTGDDKEDNYRPPGDDNSSTSSPHNTDTYQNGDDNSSGGRYFGVSLGSHALIKKGMGGQGESNTDLSSPLSPMPASFRAKPGESLTVADYQADQLAEYLENPPAWFRKQAASCAEQGSPERLVNPLANSVAIEVFGSPQRWREVKQAIEPWLRGVGNA
jgi:hypothetical protein